MPPDADPSPPRVLLLHDERAAERIDTSDVLAEAAHVAAALRELGYEPRIEPVGLDLRAVDRLLARHRPVAVFNLVESLAGRAELIHVVPALLEAQGQAFTGNAAAAQLLTSNKRLAKRQLEQAGTPTPQAWTPDCAGEGRWIVKSVWEHASVGIDDGSIAAGAAAVPELIRRRRAELGGEWFAERFIEGRELNVALLAGPHGGPAPLPVSEIAFESFPAGKPRIVGYAAKWQEDSFEYRHTPRRFDVEPPLAARAVDLALSVWRLFGLEGYARIDFRVDSVGEPWVLEVNSNPCLSPDAGFAAALKQADVAFTDAVAWLMADALGRGARAHGHVRDT
jgi:D-alanine-D-alanine ligase